MAVASILLILAVAPWAAVQEAPLIGDLPCAALQEPGTGDVNVTTTDDAGRLLPGVELTIIDTQALFSDTNVTDVNGTARFIGVPATTEGVLYIVVAYHPRYVSAMDDELMVYEMQTVEELLVLRGATIYGRVTDAAGRSVNATVSAVSTSPPYLTNTSTRTSLATGGYALNGLPGDQSLYVNVSATGFQPQSKRVDLGVGANVLQDFELASEFGSISGHVYHAVTMIPLQNANVSIQVGEDLLTKRTDSAGSYKIENVTEGEYVVTASKDGYYTETETAVEVIRNATTAVDFYLTEKPTRFYGIVRSGTLLLVGVNVSVAGTAMYNISGADGSYEIANLTAGIYTLVASAVGYQTLTVANLTIALGSEIQQNFNMVGLPGAILRGKVYAANTQEPLSNVLITIVSLRPQPISRATNIYGEFEFAGLAAGTYTIHVERTGFRPIEVSDILVSEDAPVNLTLELMPLREGFEGFIFGFDMAHSMMILALFLTMLILTVAIYLRVRTFQAPGTSPAVLDEPEEGEGEEPSGTGDDGERPDGPDDGPGVEP